MGLPCPGGDCRGREGEPACTGLACVGGGVGFLATGGFAGTTGFLATGGLTATCGLGPKGLGFCETLGLLGGSGGVLPVTPTPTPGDPSLCCLHGDDESL